MFSFPITIDHLVQTFTDVENRQVDLASHHFGSNHNLYIVVINNHGQTPYAQILRFIFGDA